MRATDGYVPTGADRLDDTIYVVERRFSLLGGFATRIVSLPAAAVRPGARLVGRSRWPSSRPPLIGENFEAIAARRGPDGQVLLYLLSDDNFIAAAAHGAAAAVAPAGSASGGERVDRAHQRPEG